MPNMGKDNKHWHAKHFTFSPSGFWCFSVIYTGTTQGVQNPIVLPCIASSSIINSSYETLRGRPSLLDGRKTIRDRFKRPHHFSVLTIFHTSTFTRS